ncbi:MAG: hypothetical protein Q8K49_04385 [Brevundimonas sp.]|nr:hypothetical protein [Brevundimonas sp.]
MISESGREVYVQEPAGGRESGSAAIKQPRLATWLSHRGAMVGGRAVRVGDCTTMPNKDIAASSHDDGHAKTVAFTR